LSPILARRLELYIVRKDLQEAGILADFMTNIIDCTHEDKLRILSALPVQERLVRITEIAEANHDHSGEQQDIVCHYNTQCQPECCH